MSALPVLRLEVESMKYSILAAFSEYKMRIDEDIKRAVDNFCTPETLMLVIQKATNDAITQAITNEVEHFYRYGNGRRVIRDAVLAKLDKEADV